MKIGFIGLGQMGSGMAANLMQGGSRGDRVQPDAAPGVRRSRHRVRKSPKTSPTACRGEAVMTMLADDAAVENVTLGTHGILASLPPRAVHISSSTISVALSARLAARHAAAGQRFVAAPVFGRPEAAAAGQLFVIAAGEACGSRVAAPLLAAIGQRTFTVSEEPRTANLVKLSGNFLIASVIESLGEAVALVGKGGVDPRQYIEMLDLDLVQCSGLQDLRRIDRAEESSSSRRLFRGARPQGHWPGAGRGGRTARATGLRKRAARPIPDTAGARRRELDWSAIARLSAPHA